MLKKVWREGIAGCFRSVETGPLTLFFETEKAFFEEVIIKWETGFVLAEKIVEMELCIQSHRDEREHRTNIQRNTRCSVWLEQSIWRRGSFLGESKAGARLARGFKLHKRVWAYANSNGKCPKNLKCKTFLNKQKLMNTHRKQLHLSHHGSFQFSSVD